MSSIMDGLFLLNPEEVTDPFINSFVFEYGEAKARELTDKIAHSSVTEDFLNNLVLYNRTPDPEVIISKIHSIGLLALSKPEKIAYSSLVLLQFWRGMCEMNARPFNEEDYNKIAFEVIYKCSKMKFLRGSGMFDSYFKELAELVNEAIKRKVQTLAQQEIPKRKDRYSTVYINENLNKELVVEGKVYRLVELGINRIRDLNPMSADGYVYGVIDPNETGEILHINENDPKFDDFDEFEDSVYIVYNFNTRKSSHVNNDIPF